MSKILIVSGMCCGVVLAALGDLRADDAGSVPEVVEIQLTLSPQALAAPALRNPLLPPWRDRTEGNAAPIYYRAALQYLYSPKEAEKFWDDVRRLLKTPIADLPKDEVRAALSGFRNTMAEAEVAARRKYCRWEFPLAEAGDQVFGMLMDEYNSLRSIGWLLALRARLEIAEGRHADAIQTLQTGHAMARHIADSPLLLGGMVGVSIAEEMNHQLAAFIGSPGAPNLYWSLSALRRPPVDLSQSAEFEGEGAYAMFPELLDAKTRRLTPEQWRAHLDRLLQRMDQSVSLLVDTHDQSFAVKQRIGIDRVLKQAEVAKAGLKQRGHKERDLKDMADAHAILLYSALVYDELCDDHVKWLYLPYNEASANFDAAQRLATEGKKLEIVPLADVLLPATPAAQRSVARYQRSIELLRTIEAIRAYAGNHGGKFPEALADMSDVPIPSDPASGNAFQYVLDGKTAMLQTPAADGIPITRYSLQMAD